jgi:predicted RNase H-like HicB family nuclease
MPLRSVMTYKVALYPTEEGFSVSVPSLPGCWSQGETEEEALENIQDAIREYLAVAAELAQGADSRFHPSNG